MIYPRTKLISQLHELIQNSTSSYISIVWEKWIGKTTVLNLIKESPLFTGESILSYDIENISSLEEITLTEDNIPSILIIDNNNSVFFSNIRSFIESKSFNWKVIFTSNEIINEEGVENFIIPGISFREYSEGMWQVIDVGTIMSGTADIGSINTLRDTYIHLGQFPTNLTDSSHVEVSFQEKLQVMNTEIFKKEEWDFLEFIRTVAMNVGDIFKEERIAKNMNISRRKVRKYTEILLKYHLIKAVGPWVENTTTELSRHVKVYFTDLSYFYAALGVSYYHGEGKQGVMENFILIELERKLRETHEIHFYRKKSGAEVSFVLIEKSSNKLTPIEITTRSSDIIPQALKSFYETYSDRIDHSMIMNDAIATQKTINWAPVIILPHIAI